jgi:hypothetical protein
MTTGIPEQDLHKYKCIVMYDDERVGDAIALLRDQKGMDWWYLVVEKEQGGYAVASFGSLEKPLEERGEPFLTTPLHALIGSVLKTAEVAEQGTLTLTDAQTRARDSEGQAVVIVQNGEFLGVIPNMTRGTRSGGLFESQLVTMMGEYAPIPQAGVLSRRRLMKNKNVGA